MPSAVPRFIDDLDAVQGKRAGHPAEHPDRSGATTVTIDRRRTWVSPVLQERAAQGSETRRDRCGPAGIGPCCASSLTNPAFQLFQADFDVAIESASVTPRAARSFRSTAPHRQRLHGAFVFQIAPRCHIGEQQVMPDASRISISVGSPSARRSYARDPHRPHCGRRGSPCRCRGTGHPGREVGRSTRSTSRALGRRLSR